MVSERSHCSSEVQHTLNHAVSWQCQHKRIVKSSYPFIENLVQWLILESLCSGSDPTSSGVLVSPDRSIWSAT